MGSGEVAPLYARKPVVDHPLCGTHTLPITISISLVGANVGVGIFNVVTFPIDPCTTSQGLNGTCLTSDECTTVGGSGDGTCASGFGVCCSVTQTCGETTSTNNTYLSQSATKVANVCTYTICPTSTDICQFRIDFEKFVMADASSTTFTKGTCVDDNLVISSPTGPNPPLVCGTLTGHHMYVTASSTCNTIQATIGSTDTTTSREWSMRVSQIECTNPLLPPSGCLQYFTGLTGYYSSNCSTSEQSTVLHLLPERGGILQYGVLHSHHRIFSRRYIRYRISSSLRRSRLLR